MAFPSFGLSFIIILLSIYNLRSSAAINPPSDHQPLSTTAALHIAPILSNLRFADLSATITNLSSTIPWSSPITLFAPTSSVPSPSLSILKHHLVPGLFTSLYLTHLPLGSLIETISPNVCLTLTSSDPTIFLDGVEIHRPDLFDDGRILIHGIRSLLSPSPCNRSPSDVMIPMLRDAIVRLRSRGYGVLALAMKARWTELVGLDNITVFGVDDGEVFSSGKGRAYVNGGELVVVPGRMMRHKDLARLGEGTVMETMERGRNLVVTESGGGGVVKISYVPIKAPDAVWNGRIVVHGLWFPFPRLYLADMANKEDTETDAEISAAATATNCDGDCKVGGPPAASKIMGFWS